MKIGFPHTLLGTLALVGCAANSSSALVDRSESPSTPEGDASVTDDGGGGSTSSTSAGAGVFLAVPPDAASCPMSGPSAHSTGCSCSASDQTASCWTGPANLRNVGTCHDGTQQCFLQGEGLSGIWGPCVGQQQQCDSDAATPAVDAGMPNYSKCPCVPGSVISCDEDCTVKLFCDLTAIKTCMPDGTWGQCHEEKVGSDDPTKIAYVSGCTNIGNGCGGPDGKGIYVGDCSAMFQCKQAPSGE